MWMTEPPPVMIAAAAWVQANALVRFVSIIARQLPVDMPGRASTGWMPALLTRVSSLPAHAEAARTSSWQASSSVRSAASAVATPPAASIRRTTASAPARSRW
jgi:hypothetical protein